jgi:alpha-N-arabinofuranosidase
LANLHPERPLTVTVEGLNGEVDGRILTGAAMNTMNTFDDPDTITAEGFEAFQRVGEVLQVQLPEKSVLVLTGR